MTDLITRAREALEAASLSESDYTSARAYASLRDMGPDLARLALAAEELAEAVDTHIQHQLDADQPVPRKLEGALTAFNAIAKGEQP